MINPLRSGGNSRSRKTPRLGGTIVRAVDAGMDTRRVNGPSDPVTTTVDVVFTKKITYRLVQTGTTPVQVTNAILISELPAVRLTYRIQKVSFYAQAAAGQFIEVVDFKSDEASFVDFGTQGSVRPQIHLRPAWQLRNQWWDNATAETFYECLSGAGVPGIPIILQATLEVRLMVPDPAVRLRMLHTPVLRDRSEPPVTHAVHEADDHTSEMAERPALQRAKVAGEGVDGPWRPGCRA
jgi:hypothetical protein